MSTATLEISQVGSCDYCPLHIVNILSESLQPVLCKGLSQFICIFTALIASASQERMRNDGVNRKFLEVLNAVTSQTGNSRGSNSFK